MKTNNPHAEVAQYGQLEYEEREIEATLAIAYAQDTASLIAFVNWVDTHNAQVGGVVYDKAVADIIERLGLNG